jgi:uncharacterized membrane protein
VLSSRSVYGWMSAVVACAVIAFARPAVAERGAPQTLVFAPYDNEKAAQQAFASLKDAERKGVIRIDSFAVISKDAKGRVRVRPTQKRTARNGVIIGTLAEVFGAPAGGDGGGGIDYLMGDAVGIPGKTIDSMKSSFELNQSAIVAVVDDRWAIDLEQWLLVGEAKEVMDHKIVNPAGGQAPSDGKANAQPVEGTSPANR